MKKIILVSVILFLITALCQPALTLAGAADGLMIWFEKLLPTLLPFLIAVNLLQNGDVLTSLLNRFPRKRSIAAALTAAIPGFLFGLPVGAKLTSDFTRKGLLSPETGNVLLCSCNQLSPAFVGTYVMLQCLNQPNLIGISYLILYLPPALLCLCYLLFYPKDQQAAPIRYHGGIKKNPAKQDSPPASRFPTVFEIMDASIINGFETITRLGGYLILFGILCQYLEALLPVTETLRGCLMMVMEVTSGIHYFSQCEISFPQKYVLCMTALSFGGLCTHAQTFSVINKAPLSKRVYVLAKLSLALLTLALSALVIRILY